MIENIYQFIILISITVCTLLGITFFAIPTPKDQILRHYRYSKKIIGLSYLILGILMLLNTALGLSNDPELLFTFPAIIISSSQAYLFTFTLLTLINPRLSTRHYMWLQLSPILLFILLFFVSNIIWGNQKIYNVRDLVAKMYHPTIIIRFLFFVFYIFQLIYYTYLFQREKKKFVAKMYDYYSDDTVLRLRWVEYAFYAALGIGIFAFFSYFFPTMLFDCIFVSSYTLFYIFYAFGYLHYDLFYKIIEKVVDPQTSDTGLISTSPDSITTTLQKNFLVLMEEQKPYLQKSITSDDVATMLHTNRTYLSTMVNLQYGFNFNTYINSKRIEYACKLMNKRPGLSIAEVAELVGFADSTHFCRQFKAIKGCTTKEWRKENRLSNMDANLIHQN